MRKIVNSFLLLFVVMSLAMPVAASASTSTDFGTDLIKQTKNDVKVGQAHVGIGLKLFLAGLPLATMGVMIAAWWFVRKKAEQMQNNPAYAGAALLLFLIIGFWAGMSSDELIAFELLGHNGCGKEIFQQFYQNAVSTSTNDTLQCLQN